MYPIPLVLSSLTLYVSHPTCFIQFNIWYGQDCPLDSHVYPVPTYSTCPSYPTLLCGIALIPGPSQLSITCNTKKLGRAWYLFSSEHNVIRKWRKFAKLWYLGSFWLFWAKCTHAQLNLPSSIPSILTSLSWEKTPDPLRFTVLEATKSCWEGG